MDRIVEVLLEKESMTGDEFRALLAQFAQVRLRWLLDASLVLCCPWVTSRVRGPPGCLQGRYRPPANRRRLLGHSHRSQALRSTLDRPALLIAFPLQIPQENLDAVARQKQPDAELQLA